ncbi:immunity 49 family protein [Streptomyces sp. H10-C2]|uniref:immunity 49 family protein n=1 Tax=unclassified Streptomyces TaxID=2593676 RepID=UPI0024BA3410|nr:MULTISPECIES: immunity 49 family protein [unclassified Streptomyces]MDJ0345623.1 immunity 49 family protein [Streptomyces sp. PH10-H1]MDJ0372988.1 immunity 49 family protein [Streptomyces sp. H10-C2]
MAPKISRPEYDPGEDSAEWLQEIDEDTLEEIDDLSDSPDMFGLTFSKTLNTAFVHCLHDPTANTIESWEAWVAAMQTGSALFASASAPEGTTVECMIAHKVRTIPASGTRHFAHAATWLEAFWLAVICRDQARMTQLCNVPIEQLRASGAQFEEYIYHWVDALQTYWLERPGLGEKLVTAFDGTSPDTLRSVDRELMLKILYPPLNLFHRFISQDPEKFNDALVEAIQLHKEYWTADEERSEDLSGAVALAPLAIACLAYDAGRPIDVESEYVPENLLDRSWLGEFEI